MQEDHTHAGPDGLGHTLDHFILHVAMGGMAPPDQHIGFGELLGGHPMVRVLQGDSGGLDSVFLVQKFGNRAMHGLGVDLGNDAVLVFVDVLAPDGDTDRHGFSCLAGETVALALSETLWMCLRRPEPVSRRESAGLGKPAALRCFRGRADLPDQTPPATVSSGLTASSTCAGSSATGSPDTG